LISDRTSITRRRLWTFKVQCQPLCETTHKKSILRVSLMDRCTVSKWTSRSSAVWMNRKLLWTRTSNLLHHQQFLQIFRFLCSVLMCKMLTRYYMMLQIKQTFLLCTVQMQIVGHLQQSIQKWRLHFAKLDIMFVLFHYYQFYF